MFTGLIQEVGRIGGVGRAGDAMRLTVEADTVTGDMAVGDSVNIDGACQTVVAFSARSFQVESVEETLQRTTFGSFRTGRPVNLERSLRLQDRLGGHLVMGHVDGVGTIAEVQPRGDSWIFAFHPPAELNRYIATKGSITVDGISLTVVKAGAEAFTVSVIPHTFDTTTLGQSQAGDSVNLEVDIIARYTERLHTASPPSPAPLTMEKLRDLGY